MKKNEDLLIDFLMKHENSYVNASSLSDLLNVSTRQIRKYIQSINKKKRIILSSHKGYKIDKNQFSQSVSMKEKSEFSLSNPQDRQFLLAKTLLLSSNSISITELFNLLFVSEATLDRDLEIIREQLARFQIDLIKKNKMITINGTETKKRAFMRSLIKQQSFDFFAVSNYHSLLHSKYELNSMKHDLKNIFEKNQTYMNDYVLDNFIVHLTIMIDRIKAGYEIVSSKKETKIYSNLIVDLYHYMEDEFSISLNPHERANIYLLVQNNISAIDYHNMDLDSLEDYIDPAIIEFSESVITMICNEYYLDHFDREFQLQYTIHLNNLFQRVENNYTIRNPLTAKIQSEYPLIYDIAVSMAQEIMKNFGIKINEDEIAFLAFHVGGYFERKMNKNKLRTLIVTPDYYQMKDSLEREIKERFQKELVIVGTLSTYEFKMLYADGKNDNVQMIISNALDPTIKNVVTVSPFLSEEDLLTINHKILETRSKIKTKKLIAQLNKLLNSELFVGDSQITKKRK